MKPWILAERHKDWSCRQFVNPSDCFSEPLCIVPLNPNMVWMSVRDEECNIQKWMVIFSSAAMSGITSLIKCSTASRNFWALVTLLKLLMSMTVTTYPISSSPYWMFVVPLEFEWTLVVEVCDQNGLAEPELPCQFIFFLSHHWLNHNGPTDA